MEITSSIRAAIYVDGCNLYSGMRTASMRRFYWLDLASLGESFLKDGQKLVCAKYFTARFKGNHEKSERHSVYIDALNATGRVEIIEGVFQREPFFCGTCRVRREIPKEKQTDTNIATELLADAFLDRWDIAFLVSGDSDMLPPIRYIRKQFPFKRILVAFPPGRASVELTSVANGTFNINHSMLSRSQLPDEIRVGPVILRRPAKWS